MTILYRIEDIVCAIQKCIEFTKQQRLHKEVMFSNTHV